MRWLTEALTATHSPPAAEVAAYFQSAQHPELINDELACNAAVLGVILTKAGVRAPRTLAAKTYLSFGTPVDGPRAGAIVLVPVPEDGSALRAGIVHSVPERGEEIVALMGTRGARMVRESIHRLAIVACRWPLPGSGASQPAPAVPVPLAPAAAAIEPQSAEAAPMLLRVGLEPGAEPAVVEIPLLPASPPLPSEPQPVPLPAGASKLHLLPDEVRRRAARESVRDAVAHFNRTAADGQLRYEAALMVVNNNVEAMSDMRQVAAIEGVTVQAYAQRVIELHNATRRRALYIYAVEAQALKDINAATGDAIDLVTAKAVETIRSDD